MRLVYIVFTGRQRREVQPKPPWWLPVLLTVAARSSGLAPSACTGLPLCSRCCQRGTVIIFVFFSWQQWGNCLAGCWCLVQFPACMVNVHQRRMRPSRCIPGAGNPAWRCTHRCCSPGMGVGGSDSLVEGTRCVSSAESMNSCLCKCAWMTPRGLGTSKAIQIYLFFTEGIGPWDVRTTLD